MKILKGIGLVLAGLLVLIIVFLGYMGFFSKLQVQEYKTGPYLIAYTSFTGPYAETGKVFDEVYKKLQADGILTGRGIGLYYDDPAKVPANSLRSDCGVIIESENMAVFNKVKNKYKTMTIPEANRMVIQFPIKNPLSYMIGPMKVYPVFGKYIQQKNYKMTTVGLEVYDLPAKKIFFMGDIQK